MFANLMQQDEQLVGAGFPPLSPWWQEQLRGFYRSDRKRLVVRAGRRGGKSSTLARVAVNEVLNGAHKVPPGDVGAFAFVSTKKSEARERLRTCVEILQALGAGFDQAADELRIHGSRRCIRVYAANYRTAVGFTCIGMVADEVSRWRDDATGANPAREVLASMRPAMATMPHSREFVSSSPFSTLDYHYDLYELGTTETQQAAHGTTWDCNPTLTEADCRKLEPDEATFEREYAAVPMAGGEHTFFDARAVDASVGELWVPQPRDSMVAGADFGFESDHSAIYVAALRPDGVYRPVERQLLKPTAEAPLRPSETVESFASLMSKHHIGGLMADAHYRASIMEHLSKHELGFLDAPRDVPSSYVRARVLMHQGAVVLPDDKQLLRDLKEVMATPTASGRISIKLPKRQGGGHCDMVSALVLALWQRSGYDVPVPDTHTAAELEEQREIERLEQQVRNERLGLAADEWDEVEFDD